MHETLKVSLKLRKLTCIAVEVVVCCMAECSFVNTYRIFSELFDFNFGSVAAPLHL